MKIGFLYAGQGAQHVGMGIFSTLSLLRVYRKRVESSSLSTLKAIPHN